MGSQQSVPDTKPAIDLPSDAINTKDFPKQESLAAEANQHPEKRKDDEPKRIEKKKKVDVSKLNDFAKVQYKCRKKKKRYNKCFNYWYSAGFLAGKDMEGSSADKCEDQFEAYRLCVLMGLKRQRDEEGLPPPKEGSILSEVYEYDDDDDE